MMGTWTHEQLEALADRFAAVFVETAESAGLKARVVNHCGDCAHFSRCQRLIQAKADWQECDWTPSRFVRKQAGGEARP